MVQTLPPTRLRWHQRCGAVGTHPVRPKTEGEVSKKKTRRAKDCCRLVNVPCARVWVVRFPKRNRRPHYVDGAGNNLDIVGRNSAEGRPVPPWRINKVRERWKQPQRRARSVSAVHLHYHSKMVPNAEKAFVYAWIVPDTAVRRQRVVRRTLEHVSNAICAARTQWYSNPVEYKLLVVVVHRRNRDQQRVVCSGGNRN